MAKAMHKGTTVPRSVAWEYFHEVTGLDLSGESDEKLAISCEFCWLEVQEVRIEHSKRCFHVCMTTGGYWAAEVLPTVSASFPKTRMRLCQYIVEAWLHSKDRCDEVFFATVLHQWPSEERCEAAKVMRKVIEFRFGEARLSAKTELVPRSARFITSYTCGGVEGNAMLRTVAKAIARFAAMSEIIKIVAPLQEGDS